MPTVNPAAMVHRRIEAPSPSHTPTPFWSQTGPYLATPFSKYSDRLKKMCAEGADRRRPEKPDCCRYCGEVMVFLQLTYTVDNAGQWYVIVSPEELMPDIAHSTFATSAPRARNAGSPSKSPCCRLNRRASMP